MQTDGRFKLGVVLFLSLMPVWAQQDGTPATTALEAQKAFQWNAALEGYASSNFANPASGVNSLRTFDTHADAFRLGAATVDLDYKTDHLGAHLTGGYGDVYDAIARSEPLKGANSYLTQFFVTYRPLTDNALQIDFGKFYTSVGAEVVDTQADFNYSRSLLFALAEPYYHFGLRASVPITKSFTAGVQVVNGWNNVWDNNSGKTFGFTTALTKSQWSWSQVVLVGPEKDGTNAGKRELVNEIATFNPRASIQSYAELIYGRDTRVGLNPNADSWYGLAVAARWTTGKKLSFSPRMEYYVDQTGFTTGMPQHVREATGTAEYKLHALVRVRLEYREDLSNRAYFQEGQSGRRKQQGTLTMALLISAKGER